MYKGSPLKSVKFFNNASVNKPPFELNLRIKSSFSSTTSSNLILDLFSEPTKGLEFSSFKFNPLDILFSESKLESSD